MDQMTCRERFHAVMKFQPADRIPMIEWAPWWDKTLDRWKSEGLALSDRVEILKHFGLDVLRGAGIRNKKPSLPGPAYHGAPIIRTEDDYEKIREHLFPPFEIPDGWQPMIEEQKRGDCILRVWFEGYFWYPRTLLGIEQHLYAFYDQPELMHRMNSELCDYHVEQLKKVLEVFVPDFISPAEDMSYNHGPMISRELFDEFITPYYKRVLSALQGYDTYVIVDSDGDITEPTAWFADAGCHGLLPLERQSGVDIDVLQARYPKQRFIGHYDKMVMNRGEEAIRGEFERLLPAIRKGGFIPSVDHQTPPGVSLQDYYTYVRVFKEYAARD
jgi:hypothetical protein